MITILLLILLVVLLFGAFPTAGYGLNSDPVVWVVVAVVVACLILALS